MDGDGVGPPSCTNELLFCVCFVQAMDTSADGRISFDEMVKYWEAREVRCPEPTPQPALGTIVSTWVPCWWRRRTARAGCGPGDARSHRCSSLQVQPLMRVSVLCACCVRLCVRACLVSVQVGHGGSKYNKLLVKDRVGAPRTSTYDLPPIAHKFGKGAAERVVGTREGELPAWRVMGRHCVA